MEEAGYCRFLVGRQSAGSLLTASLGGSKATRRKDVGVPITCSYWVSEHNKLNNFCCIRPKAYLLQYPTPPHPTSSFWESHKQESKVYLSPAIPHPTLIIRSMQQLKLEVACNCSICRFIMLTNHCASRFFLVYKLKYCLSSAVPCIRGKLQKCYFVLGFPQFASKLISI